jgi:ATP dependent DNA ligase C terminal region
MSDKFAISDNGFDDDSTLDSYAANGAAVLELDDCEGTAIAEWTGAHCEKCKARLVSDVVSICRHCGWYASLGSYIEVDPDWEVASEPESASASVEPAPRPSHLQVWLGLLPRWSWVIIASVFVLIVESVAARIVTPADSWIRTAWSLSQLGIGLLAAFGCHILNFMWLTADDAEIGMIDLLMKPLKLWGRAIENLPSRLWVANAAVSGLAAAVLSVLVIGGIPYDRLWDWGFKEPPKQDLMGAVMDQVQKVDGNGEDDLEKSINDFAGKKADEPTEKPKAEPPKPQQFADCVILGYAADRDGRVTSLVLGTASGGQLVYAGNVAPKLPDDEMKEFAATLRLIESKRPIIRIDYEATWVQPKLTCRVGFGQRAKSGRLRDIEWSKLLGTIEKH